VDAHPEHQPPDAMTASPEAPAVPPAAIEDPARDPMARAVAGWIGQFGRTLKTCRLYDAANPAAVRFREELAAALARLLDEHGPVTCKFTSDDILFDEVSLHPARSREDNLALPFHRDGVRALTFTPGIAAREVQALVDAVLLVTGQAQTEDDLVTLLWEANLQHVDIDYVPAEGDVGSGPGEAEEAGALAPWPTAAVAEDEAEAEGGGTAAPDAETASGTGSRSDDWTTGDATVEIEAGFEELDALAPTETKRFRDEFAAEHEVSLMTTALAIAHAYLDAPVNEEDRAELGRFIPRMLRLAIGQGSWLEAREAMTLLRECGTGEWSVETFAQELLQPVSIGDVAGRLDRGDPGLVHEFVALARSLGEPALDWIGLVLAESQQRRVRRVLAEAVTELCRDHPERIAPWLADRRWEVVRNAVQILGWIGGDAIAGMLEAPMRHPEPRVRREVVAALGQVSAPVARPLLLEMLNEGDSRLFASILHQLAASRDADVARVLAGYLRDPKFEQRSGEERRAVYAALAGAGTDDILPDLEAELVKGGAWPFTGDDEHRFAVARCIARLGTVRAIEALQRGAASRRPSVRQACVEALRSVRG
jgi:HEAT repeat protein